MPIIAAAPNARAATGPETWDAEMRVRYLPPVPPTLPALAAVSSVMTPVVSPAPPMVPPPPGMMPSSPAGIENPQFDEGPPDNELHQPVDNTCGNEGVYHHAGATGHALFNQSTPALPNCEASQFSESHTASSYPVT